MDPPTAGAASPSCRGWHPISTSEDVKSEGELFSRARSKGREEPLYFPNGLWDWVETGEGATWSKREPLKSSW